MPASMRTKLTAGFASAGVAIGAAGLWTWRSRKSPEIREVEDVEDAVPPRNGPMVAVYLDKPSLEKLQQEYPGTELGRLRKVVIQYNPSPEERGAYEPHFGGLATVKLSGEASSENRLALMASVSHAGTPVEPQSLSCAVDITPGSAGGGPLGSAALIEQIRQAGATSHASWKGELPPLSAHDREFPSEEGSFNRLNEPLTVTGSICRADWVEGESGRCRTLTDTGEKRIDGWVPKGCVLCNTFEASPCRDLFVRFESLRKRVAALEPPQDPPSEIEPENSPDGDAPGGVDNPGRLEREEGTAAEGTGEVESEEPESEEEKLRREELEMLTTERDLAVLDMVTCAKFYRVFDDLSADDGDTPDLSDDGDEDRGEGGGGSVRREADDSGGVAAAKMTPDEPAGRAVSS